MRLTFDRNGKVYGMPAQIRLGDGLDVQLIAEDEALNAAQPCNLSLVLSHPAPISEGEITLGFGSGATTFQARDASAWLIQSLLNDLGDVESAGGLDVTGSDGVYTLTFREAGVRSALTVSHSSIGSLSSRCRTVVAGSVSARAVFRLDLSLQVLAEETSFTAINPGGATVANVSTGGVSAYQIDRITIPDVTLGGKFRVSVAAGLETPWLPVEISSYRLELEMEELAPGGFLVSRDIQGDSVLFQIARSEVGAFAAVTVESIIPPARGIEGELDTGLVAPLLDFADVSGRPAMLVFTYQDRTLFAQGVQLAPLVEEHPAPL